MLQLCGGVAAFLVVQAGLNPAYQGDGRGASMSVGVGGSLDTGLRRYDRMSGKVSWGRDAGRVESLRLPNRSRLRVMVSYPP